GARTPPRSSGLVGLVVVVVVFGIWLIRVISSLLQITAVHVRFAVPPTIQVEISIFFSGSGRNQDVVHVYAELVRSLLRAGRKWKGGRTRAFRSSESKYFVVNARSGSRRSSGTFMSGFKSSGVCDEAVGSIF